MIVHEALRFTRIPPGTYGMTVLGEYKRSGIQVLAHDPTSARLHPGYENHCAGDSAPRQGLPRAR